MIIVWRGKGILGLIPLIGVPILSTILATMLMDQQRKIARVLPFFDDQVAGFTVMAAILVGWFAGGLICFLLGRRWNRDNDFHHIYFVPVQYLGLASSVASGGIVLSTAGLVLVALVTKLTTSH
jgi:hypothetical protein